MRLTKTLSIIQITRKDTGCNFHVPKVISSAVVKVLICEQERPISCYSSLFKFENANKHKIYYLILLLISVLFIVLHLPTSKKEAF